MERTHRVSRISSTPAHGLRVFFNALGHSLEWEPGTPEQPGSPQDVPAVVAEACERDEGLKPHFLIEPIVPADVGRDLPPATDEAAARPPRRRPRTEAADE